MAISTNMRSFDASYSVPANVQRRQRSSGRRKSAGKQTARTSAFNLALSVGIVSSLGVLAIVTFVLLGG